MNTAVIERLEFAPPPQGGFGRAFGLALAAHLLLILALTWGLRWKNEPHDLAVQAELWSPSVQQASPKAAPRPPAAAVEHQPPPLPKPGASEVNSNTMVCLPGVNAWSLSQRNRWRSTKL